MRKQNGGKHCSSSHKLVGGSCGAMRKQNGGRCGGNHNKQVGGSCGAIRKQNGGRCGGNHNKQVWGNARGNTFLENIDNTLKTILLHLQDASTEKTGKNVFLTKEIPDAQV